MNPWTILGWLILYLLGSIAGAYVLVCLFVYIPRAIWEEKKK
jgi:hypothetical protein